MSSKQRIVKIVMVKPIYKKTPWIIPIEQLSPNNYLTGQNLSYEKMIGKMELTPEEKQKYPFVIDPTASYKAPDFQGYDITTDEKGEPVNHRDFAMYKLIMSTGIIAENQVVFDKDPIKYIGYFFDKESEAVRFNQIDDIRFEAESSVRSASLEMRKKIALLLNYKVTGKEFFINLATVSEDILKRELVKIAREKPDLVLSCFPEKNPGIENETFVVELLHYNIISQKPDGDIFSGSLYLGKSVDDVVKLLSRREMQSEISKWNIRLGELKGSTPANQRSTFPSASKDGVNDLSLVEQMDEYVSRLKSSLFDKDVNAAIGYMTHIKKVYSEIVRNGGKPEFEFPKYEAAIVEIQRDIKRTKLSDELSELPLDKIQAKIKHHATPYSEDECKAFWEDKDQLIKYMLEKI